MNSFSIAELTDKTFFTEDVFLDKNFLLLNSLCPFTESLKKMLSEWKFTDIFTNGNKGVALAKKENALQYQNDSIQLAKADSEDFTSVSFDEVGIQPEQPKKEISGGVKKAIQEANNNISSNEKSRMDIVQDVYNEYMDYIKAVYTHYATHKVLNYMELSESVKELCIFIKDNRRFVLRITPSQDTITKNYLISHSMRSTVIAIVIGLQLRMTLSKLVDLGICCILHEIGQIRLPPQLYMTDRRLSPSERTKLATHAVLGFNIVKENNFPSQIQLGVLEHHERENGTGYPRRLTGSQIDIFAKIIGVACSFEAITAPRHFRQARSSYAAMVEILKNEGKQFDDTVIKALLYSLSLFPIGAYVYLVNGKIAQVTDASPASPGNPIVSYLGEKDSSGGPVTVQTDNAQNKIVRVLSKQEVADVLKTLNLKN